MEKTMTLNLRVNPTVKQQAEDVLKQLGIPMATAIDMYLRQITMTGGIPFYRWELESFGTTHDIFAEQRKVSALYDFDAAFNG